MKVIAKLEITATRPEEMRVIEINDTFEVQTLNTSGTWICQKEHSTEVAALTDCLDWYK